MDTPLLKTKLYLPATRPRLVDRPRLLERLDRLLAPGCRVALISAPPGFGKTTLAAQWLGHLDWPVSWLSLDERDNRPALFFAYLIAALQNCVPGAGQEAKALLELPGVNFDEVVTLVVNDLANAPAPFILALDDLHAITNPQLLHALDLLIEAQPRLMRLLLLSREDPALPLAGRRVRGELVEVRQADLRFTLAEALGFLNQSMGLEISTRQTEQLETRTEGWIAGLQLAAISLQNAPDVERFLDGFSGSHHFVLDYLVEEVLSRQPETKLRFLLETSILERLCAGLCAALTGGKHAEMQRLLEQLAGANLFLISLDEERRWFRYHHLFRDLLLARLQADLPGRIPLLERRAADWYAANAEPRLAVEHALRAQDPEHAADLISHFIAARWQNVDLDFHLLINRLPWEVIAQRPDLCLQNAWLCVILGQVERILPLIEAAEHVLNAPGRLPDPTDATRRAFARILRAYLVDLANQPVMLDATFEQAYAAIPEENTGMRNSVAVVIGTIYFMEGQFEPAFRYYQDALLRDQRVNGTNAVPIATLRMGWVLQVQGRLREADDLVQQSLAYVRKRGTRSFYISGVLNLLWADLLLEWNRLEESETQIQEGLRLLEDWPIPQVYGFGLALLARLQVAQGNFSDAQVSIDRADSLQPASFHPIFQDALERARVAVWIAAGERAALETWAKATEPLSQREVHFRYEARLVVLCQAWLALGRDQAAARLLEQLDAAARGRDGRRIAILSLLAAARGEEQAHAMENLERSLTLAMPEGYLRTFLEAGPALRPVLAAWLQSHHAGRDPHLPVYARRIQAAFEAQGHPSSLTMRPLQNMLETLSTRELEVLRLVADGLTNAQIADRLVISIRTVKKHVENIHGKLDVQNRTQAVARARSLGLIP